MAAAARRQNHSTTMRPKRSLALGQATVVAQAKPQTTRPKARVQDELGGEEIQDFSADLTGPDAARRRLHHIAAHAEEQGGDRLHRGPRQEQQPEREREPQPAPQARPGA